MKACILKIFVFSYRNRLMAVGNRSIHKEGGTPKAGEAQSAGALCVSWLFPVSSTHSLFQIEKKKAELVSNMQPRVRGPLDVRAMHFCRRSFRRNKTRSHRLKSSPIAHVWSLMCGLHSPPYTVP